MIPCKVGGDIDDIQQLILLDLNFETFRVLAKEIGDEKVREIFKPHMRNSMTALVMNAQKHLRVMINDTDSMNLISRFIGCTLFLAPTGKMIVTAKGIEWHNPEGCYLSGAPVSFRRMICDDAPQGFFMNNQDYGYSNSCLDRGDCECGTILYNKADPSIDWRNRGSKDTPIPTPTFDKEKMRQFGILAIGELWLFPTQALIEWRGPDAVMKLKDAMRPLGRKWGRELSRLTGENGNDMSSLLSIIDTYNIIMGQESRTFYASAYRHETEITICPFSVAPAEIGAQCEAFCNGICEAVSPHFELCFTSKMCAGGQYCHRVIRKKLSARIVTERSA